MSQQRFQKEVMDELEQNDFDDDEVVCVYCGSPKGNSFSCCGENHFDNWRNIDE